MKQRFSTAFHSQIDEATETMNQEILAYLRSFITYTKFDWKVLLPCAMLAHNNRTSASLGMSPFFAKHGYNIDSIQQVEPLSKPSEPAKRAQVAMASAQSRMEESANQNRKEAELFKVGDRVWLNLKHIQTPKLSKKLSWINAKYQITKVIDSHTVQLNTPSGIWPRFHVDLVKRTATDPFPSQMTDEQPQLITPQIIDTIDVNADMGEEQYLEKILRVENKKIGRGYR